MILVDRSVTRVCSQEKLQVVQTCVTMFVAFFSFYVSEME